MAVRRRLRPLLFLEANLVICKISCKLLIYLGVSKLKPLENYNLIVINRTRLRQSLLVLSSVVAVKNNRVIYFWRLTFTPLHRFLHKSCPEFYTKVKLPGFNAPSTIHIIEYDWYKKKELALKYQCTAIKKVTYTILSIHEP